MDTEPGQGGDEKSLATQAAAVTRPKWGAFTEYSTSVLVAPLGGQAVGAV